MIVVEFQRGNRDPTNRRQSDDLRTVLTPAQMVTPGLLARVEKRHTFARYRINTIGLRAFMTIAQRARQPKLSSVEEPPAATGIMCSMCIGIAVND
jgi:hypothetical protein